MTSVQRNDVVVNPLFSGWNRIVTSWSFVRVFLFLSPFALLLDLRHSLLSNELNCGFNFSNHDRRLRCLRPFAIDFLLQRRQVRLRHPGRKYHVRERRGRGKVSEKRHRAEAAAAAAAAAVAGGGHQSLCEARFHDLRRGLQEKVGQNSRGFFFCSHGDCGPCFTVHRRLQLQF